MEAGTERPRVTLGIADEVDDVLASDPFIGGFVSLGSLLRRYLPNLGGRQLVVAVSVPRRDYAAALVGAGWMLSASAPDLGDPVGAFRRMSQGMFARAVTSEAVVSGAFTRIDEARPPARVLIGGKVLTLSSLRAVTALDSSCESTKGDMPKPGYLAHLTSAADSWYQRIAAPPRDLAIVGTTKWLLKDFASLIGGSLSSDDSAPLSNYVLPNVAKAAAWGTTIISSAQLRENDPIPAECQAVILDRYGAIKYLDEITVPIVVCIIDRSVADDSAAELVVQARVANSQPIGLKSLRWTCPTGFEAMAFTVAL